MRILRSTALLAALLSLLLVPPSWARSSGEDEAPAAPQATPGRFEVVGHEPLGNRGMNSALAIHGNHAYVGSRTDGKLGNLNGAGVLVVDISNPTAPKVVHEMSPPLEGNAGESSRELRVWAEQEILIVLHTNCSPAIHTCGPQSRNNMRFYDISGQHAANPRLIAELGRDTHEFFLWVDPFDPEYALLYAAGAGARMQVYDMSPLLRGTAPTAIADLAHGYPGGGLHSMSVSNDGGTAYLALLTGGFAVADTTDFRDRVPNPQMRRVTASSSRPTWAGPGAHSAVKLWERDWVYVSDEVYGEALRALGHGCPWGWGRMVDISDPTAPTVAAEYRLPENSAEFCLTDPPRPTTSFSAHNPTQTPNIVFTSWHAGGMQAIGVADPAAPVQLAELRPEPLLAVVQEDPVLSAGPDKVVMWSYPIVKDGLIYVVDLRNGLYVLRYTGPHAEEVDAIEFLEGNSNQGDALCFEPVSRTLPDGTTEVAAAERCAG
jgi:hypothetical protein